MDPQAPDMPPSNAPDCSSHAGERAAAGMKADQLVKMTGLTWHAVISLPPTPEEEPAAEKDTEDANPENADATPTIFDDLDDPREAARALCEWTEHMSEWEANFIVGVLRFRKFSDKQIEVIWRLLEEIRGLAITEATRHG